MEMLSLYDYLGQAAGKQLGEQVAKKATLMKVKMSTRYVKNQAYEGNVMLYPKSFLDEYFKVSQRTSKIEAMLEKEKESRAIDIIRAIATYTDLNEQGKVKLVRSITDATKYYLKGEADAVNKVLYGKTSNTKEK